MRSCSMDEPPVMNIMLLGSTGSGKSASGNTIIGVRETFKEDLSPESVTTTCELAQTELDGPTITVIDTVGLSDTSVKITDAQTQIEKMLTPHSVDVFLLVIKLGETLTESSKVVKWIQDHFGSKFSKHTIVLFTHGDQLHKPIERYLSKRETLRSVVDQCSGGFHVFNNKNEYRSQVTELLKKIESLRMMNAYKRYTEQDYKQTQDDLLQTQKDLLQTQKDLLQTQKETQRALLLNKCAVGAAVIVGAVGGAVTAAGGGGAMASMMATVYQAVGQEAPEAPEAPEPSMMGKVAALIGVKAAAEPGLAATVGEAALILAGVAALIAVCAGVYLLARKDSSKGKYKSNSKTK